MAWCPRPYSNGEKLVPMRVNLGPDTTEKGVIHSAAVWVLALLKNGDNALMFVEVLQLDEFPHQ